MRASEKIALLFRIQVSLGVIFMCNPIQSLQEYRMTSRAVRCMQLAQTIVLLLNVNISALWFWKIHDGRKNAKLPQQICIIHSKSDSDMCDLYSMPTIVYPSLTKWPAFSSSHLDGDAATCDTKIHERMTNIFMKIHDLPKSRGVQPSDTHNKQMRTFLLKDSASKRACHTFQKITGILKKMTGSFKNYWHVSKND